MSYFQSSELVLTPEGAIYHLGIRPQDIATQIIVVGDQDRVELISQYFDEITHKSQHREFCTHTGFYKGKKISAISTGIGTDNIDIVINELDALVNIDFETRTEKKEKTRLEIVRIGTCGILQDDIPIDSFILSTYSLGIDNVGHFYKRTLDEETKELEKQIISRVKLPKEVTPYLTKASEELSKRFMSSEIKAGITVASSGFYGPQGRQLRLQLAVDDMLKSFTEFEYNNNKITNLEMETSALFSLCNGLGHHSAAICLGLANRRKKEFTNNYESKIIELIEYVLERF